MAKTPASVVIKEAEEEIKRILEARKQGGKK